MPKFHKLVRDKIPEIIASKGQKAITTTLHTEEYLVELKKKVLEEWDEYLQAEDDVSALEELADLLEVIHALAKTHGASLQTVETLRKKKSEEREVLIGVCFYTVEKMTFRIISLRKIIIRPNRAEGRLCFFSQ